MNYIIRKGRELEKLIDKILKGEASFEDGFDESVEYEFPVLLSMFMNIYEEDMIDFDPDVFFMWLKGYGLTEEQIDALRVFITISTDIDRLFSSALVLDNFCEVANNYPLTSDIIDYHHPAEIIWSAIVAVAFYNIDSFNFSGDASRYIVACLHEDGWVYPPLPLLSENISGYMEYSNDTFLKSQSKIAFNKNLENELPEIMGKEESEPLKNYYKQNIPIVAYVEERIENISSQISRIVWKN